MEKEWEVCFYRHGFYSHLSIDLADVVRQLVMLLEQTLGLGYTVCQLVARTLGLPFADFAQILVGLVVKHARGG